MTRFDVVEADIAQLRSALEEGRVTSEELVGAYLARIDAYDKNGPRLNALVVMDANLDFSCSLAGSGGGGRGLACGVDCGGRV